MFGTPVSSGLTLGKVISGISKTLSVANQVIPLYQQAKPMIHNAKTILSVLKDVNKPNTNTISNNKKATNNIVTNSEKSITSKEPIIRTNNSPVFFL